MAKRLTKADILAVQDLPLKEIFVDEWGGSVFVRALTGAERGAYEREVAIAQNNGDTLPNYFKEKFLRHGLVGEDGKPLFSEGDIKDLAKKNGAVIDRLAQEVKTISKMGVEAVEEAEKNSVTVQSDSSGSNSSTAPESP